MRLLDADRKRDEFSPLQLPKGRRSAFARFSVAATTTSSRLVVVVVVDFSRVDDRLDYDYRTDYNYDYEIFVVDSRRL
jgi:hypothetical protein